MCHASLKMALLLHKEGLVKTTVPITVNCVAQKEFKKANFAKLFNYNVFFGDYLQYISWSVKNSKTVDTLVNVHLSEIELLRKFEFF